MKSNQKNWRLSGGIFICSEKRESWMILYAYRFLYNFYGLILVSGFVDVKIFSLAVVTTSATCLCWIHICQIFIFYRFFFLGRDRNARENDENLQMFEEFKFVWFKLGTSLWKLEKVSIGKLNSSRRWKFGFSVIFYAKLFKKCLHFHRDALESSTILFYLGICLELF